MRAQGPGSPKTPAEIPTGQVSPELVERRASVREGGTVTTTPELPPVTKPTPAATDQPLAERLERSWSTQLLAPVSNAEMPRAIDALMDYHLKCGFFGERFAGMARLHGFGPEGSVEVALAPNRKKTAIKSNVDGHGSCGLCKPPFPKERGLTWGNWRIWPNAFPYVPAKSEHILLTNQSHLAQHYSPQILADMLDFQACAAGGEQLTLHYNGTAGNSQFHLHWQATRELLPLQERIDSGALPLSDVRRDEEGRVATYDQGFYAGLLVEGTKPYLVRWATRVIDKLEADPITRGAYNLLLLKQRAGRFRLAIIPRRADNLKPEVGSIGKAGIGAFNAGGIIVLPRPEIPEDFGDAITPAMRATIVPPAELAWLGALGQESGASVLQARAGLS